jgi:hypothetical protein
MTWQTSNDTIQQRMIFKSLDDSYYIITNFKVMYSTLMRQSNITLLKEHDWKVLSECRETLYFLVRNPYDRLESFFRDKFILHPGRSVQTNNFRWQNCQKIFFDELQVSPDDFDDVQERLTTTSFDQFIEMLPSKYLLDLHLAPQVYAICYMEGDSVFELQVDGVLMVDDEDDMAFLQSKLGIDTSVRENETRFENIHLGWNERSRSIVNGLYEADFWQLGYHPKNK